MGDTSKTSVSKKPGKKMPPKRFTWKCGKILKQSIPVVIALLAVYAYFEFRPSQLRLKRLEAQVLKDLQTHFPGLGENGAPSVLQGEAKERGQRDLETVFLNVELSKHISYTRTLPDNRNSDCKRVKYDMDSLPTTTIVIIFYNEPFSVLMRTVHSILSTVDDKLLAEIMLVDDKSDDEELQDKLDYYIETRLTSKVKLLRLAERSGIPKARIAGAEAATGDVLFFVDAHCEFNVRWLEPLLEQIVESRETVVVPIIDVVDAETLQYKTNDLRFEVGGFRWNGHFMWITTPDVERKRQKQAYPGKPRAILPIQTPTMAGGLFAIDRKYFWEIGSYDIDMEGWGGENLEMSFRIWQCGGVIQTAPCSRIGHIFRANSPYADFTVRDTHAENTARLALSWMDEYIEFLYLDSPKYWRYAQDPVIGNVTERLKFRDRLGCKSFQWYMENVFPQKYIPSKDSQVYGRVSSASNHVCLDNGGARNDDIFELGLRGCSMDSGITMSLMNTGILRTEDHCATIETNASRENVLMKKCLKGNEVPDTWTLTEHQQLMHNSGKCMDYDISSFTAYLSPCNADREEQRFSFFSTIAAFDEIL